MRLSRIHSGPVLDFYTPDFSTQLELPLAGSAVSAGFPSPAEEYIEIALDLNKELIKHPAATFYARVKGRTRRLSRKTGILLSALLDGEFTLKRLAVKKEGIYLMPANAEFKPIRITEENDFLVWGSACLYYP